jgi:hypothetical protein
MKKKQLILGTIFSLIILFTSCGKKNKEQTIESLKKSFWTDNLKQEFIKKHNPKTDFDKFLLKEIITEKEFEKKPNELDSYIQSPEFENYKHTKSKEYRVVIDNLVGKSENEIATLLGQPNSKEQVSPSGTPCPCNKYNYIYDLIEIVYINGKADWITINNIDPTYIIIHNFDKYQSVNWFDDYIYLKAFTQ